MSAKFKPSDILTSKCGALNKHIELSKDNNPKKSKYGNKKVEIDGHVFPSKKESARYLQLRMLLKIGEITDLRLQVSYELNEGGTHSLRYIADFVYKSGGVEIIEDCKGFKTVVFKKKARLMKQIFGIEIKIT